MSLDLLGTQESDGGGAADIGSTATETVAETTVAAGDESTAGDNTPETQEANTELSTAGEEAEPSPAELSEEELESLSKDDDLPANTRNQIKQAWAIVGKRKEALANLQSEFDTYKQQYEGKSYLEQAEIERLRAAEELEYKLTDYTARPDDVLDVIKEKNPQIHEKVLQEAAWRALEDAEGKPNLTNLQAFIDRASAQFGDNKVNVQDVLKFIEGSASGTLDPSEVYQFGTVEEYESHRRAREQESVMRQQQELAKKNLEFAEEQGRQTIVSQQVSQIRQSFTQKLDAIRNNLKLAPIEGEPTVLADFKQQINEELGVFINTRSAGNPHLQAALNTLEKLMKANGSGPEAYGREIQQVLGMPGFKNRLDKGLADIASAAEKYLAQKAAQAALMAEGYAARQSKRPKPRAVTKSPNEAVNTETLSEEELAGLSGRERVDYEARKMTEQIRALKQSA
ncbi:MAG: hypothetical protein KF855_03380 [Acidobacteria bacterium]|nr:hypothetical protein [Acidobacteriota bacterium]